MSWTDGLFDSFSTAVSDALGSLSDSVVDSIFNRFILWIFNMIYEGLIALLTNINEMGAEIFDLNWCQLLMRLFAVLGGAFFVVGMFVSFFDLGISYQSQQGGADPMNTFLNCVKGFVAAFLFVNIPVDELRERLDEIDRAKPVYVICQSGLRSYIACRILEGNGFEAYNFSGGFRFYDAVTHERVLTEKATACGMDQ